MEAAQILNVPPDMGAPLPKSVEDLSHKYHHPQAVVDLCAMEVGDMEVYEVDEKQAYKLRAMMWEMHAKGVCPHTFRTIHYKDTLYIIRVA